MLYETIEDIVDYYDVLEGHACPKCIRIDHFCCQDAEWNCCLFIYYQGIKYELRPGDDLWVICQLRQPFQGHIWSPFYASLWVNSHWRSTHKLVKVWLIVSRIRSTIHLLWQVILVVLFSKMDQLLLA